MRKPVSKHALRRALDRVRAEGGLHIEEPVGTVVDRLWHQITKEATNGARKSGPRTTARRREPVEA